MRSVTQLGGSALLLLACAACGGGGSTGGLARLHRFEPALVRPALSRAWRVLGEGLGRRGEPVQIRFHALHGTPFDAGQHAQWTSAGHVTSGAQLRGTLGDPRIPRGWGEPVQARVEVLWSDGTRAYVPDTLVTFDATTLSVRAVEPQTLSGVVQHPARLRGVGFGHAGESASIRFISRVGTPFGQGTRAEATVQGQVLDDTTIHFVPPP